MHGLQQNKSKAVLNREVCRDSLQLYLAGIWPPTNSDPSFAVSSIHRAFLRHPTSSAVRPVVPPTAASRASTFAMTLRAPVRASAQWPTLRRQRACLSSSSIFCEGVGVKGVVLLGEVEGEGKKDA